MLATPTNWSVQRSSTGLNNRLQVALSIGHRFCTFCFLPEGRSMSLTSRAVGWVGILISASAQAGPQPRDFLTAAQVELHYDKGTNQYDHAFDAYQTTPKL